MRMIVFRENSLTDKAIIDGLKAGGTDENKCLQYLYQQNLKIITRFIIANNGNEEQAKDIFQDAVVIFYEQVKSDKYVYQSKISTYLFAIAKHLWLNELKKMRHDIAFRIEQTEVEIEDTPLQRVMEKEKRAFIIELMNNLKDECKKILTYSIFEKLTMTEICKRMGIKNEQMARNKKYMCLNYLKQTIRNSSVLSDTLKDLRGD